ncbi:DUF4386 domain-containing protein [Kribbella sp. NPDC050241]|uniref:DUF4386 domain-containing protein n=1 Tax=Kribbella sp. NPDC050241 TaxID=3364115 RepID=UPI0037ADC698
MSSSRRAALIAGVGYLTIFLLAIFANFFVLAGLIDPDNAHATFTNIAESELLFRFGLVSFLVVVIIEVVVTWALYVLFKTVNQQVSLLAAWFRLIHAAFLGVAVVFLFIALQLVSGAEYSTAFEQRQVDVQVKLTLEVFDYTWLIGLALFGVHLMLLGYLVVKSGFASRVLGALLMVAGAAYLFDTLAHSLLANYAANETVFFLIVAVPSFAGELWFLGWLLARGGKQPAATARPVDDTDGDRLIRSQ